MLLKQLKLLVTLKHTGSLAAASQKLYIAQPALSMMIKNMEAELGFQILHRTSKGVDFTAMGQLVLERAENIITLVDEIENTAMLDHTYRRDICLYTNTVSGTAVLAEIALRLMSYPDFKVNIQRCNKKEIFETMLDGGLYFGLLQTNYLDSDNEKEPPDNLVFQELLRDEMYFLIHSTHPLSNKSEVTVSDFFDYQFVTIERVEDDPILMLLRQRGYHKSAIQISDIDSLILFIARTNSFAIVPKREITTCTERYNKVLVPIKVSDFSIFCKTDWIYNQQMLSQREEKIINILSEILSDL